MPRRYRRRLSEKVEYEGGFKPGNLVVVTSPSTFEGEAIAAVIDPQKWCPEGIPVYTSHARMKYVCILTSRGDTIKSAKKV